MKLIVVISAFTITLAAALEAQAGPVQLFASEFGTPAKFFTVDSSTGSGTLVTTSSYTPGLDMRENGKLYGSANSLFTINSKTGAGTTVGPLAELMVSIAFSPNDELYAVNNTGTTLFKIDPATGTTLSSVALSGTLVANEINGIDFAPDGTLYAVGFRLYSIDVSSGAATQITPQGQTIAGSDLLLDMDFGSDGLIRAVTFSAEVNSQLYTINPATGLATSNVSTQLSLAGLASVPEPSALVLSVVGLASLTALRLRSSKRRTFSRAR